MLSRDVDSVHNAAQEFMYTLYREYETFSLLHIMQRIQYAPILTLRVTCIKTSSGNVEAKVGREINNLLLAKDRIIKIATNDRKWRGKKAKIYIVIHTHTPAHILVARFAIQIECHCEC